MKKTIGFFIPFYFMFFFIPSSVFSHALELIPQRLVLEGRERSTTLMLINRSSEPVRYRIENTLVRQTITGANERVTDPSAEEEAILNMVRFSPRQVSIGANDVQTVRIMARKPAGLPAGEYRSHLLITNIPPQTKVEETEDIAVKIDIVVSTSIPMIIRHGETSVSLKAEKPLVQPRPDGGGLLTTRIIADGNRSVFMDALLYHGKELLTASRGFAIYQPNGMRDVSFTLTNQLPPAGSSLRLVLHDREKEGEPVLKEIPLVLNY
ncbi:fimbria/pilus periplasmic chaperone [Desulfobotulus mexicanus]|nr:fimbria/pilus periplasmic chaperone [Desulfobotulus mexicanus]